MEVKDVAIQIRLDHNTGDNVSGFFNVPCYLISNKGYQTGPPVYSPYPNLVPRVLGLLGQRVSARRDSGIIDSIFPENVGSGLMTYG